jgi:hypothetical protein
MEISSSDEFSQQLEAAINEIGRENARVLAAQIKALVEQIRAGSTEKTIVVWTYEDCPENIRQLVDSPDSRFTADQVEYVVLYPRNYRGEFLELSKDFGLHTLTPIPVKLPLQTLLVYTNGGSQQCR